VARPWWEPEPAVFPWLAALLRPAAIAAMQRELPPPGQPAPGAVPQAEVAIGYKVIKCRSPLNVLKYTYDYSCY
jgi:hypothetical protein